MNPHYWAMSCAARRRSSAPKQIPEPMETVVLEKPAPQSGMFGTSRVGFEKMGKSPSENGHNLGDILHVHTHTHPRMIGSWFLRCPMVRLKFIVLSAFCTWILCRDIAGPSSRLVPCWLWVLERLGLVSACWPLGLRGVTGWGEMDRLRTWMSFTGSLRPILCKSHEWL